MEDKTAEKQKCFLQIKMNPLDDTMPLGCSTRFIHVDEISQGVLIGPIIGNIVGVDLNKPQIIIDEKQFHQYQSAFSDSRYGYDLHILLKNGEIISRSYLIDFMSECKSIMDELRQIGITIENHAIVIDDPRIVRLSADLKFHVRTESVEISETKSSTETKWTYKRVERDTSFNLNLGDGKIMLLSKTIDLIRDIFRISPSKK